MKKKPRVLASIHILNHKRSQGKPFNYAKVILNHYIFFLINLNHKN